MGLVHLSQHACFSKTECNFRSITQTRTSTLKQNTNTACKPSAIGQQRKTSHSLQAHTSPKFGKKARAKRAKRSNVCAKHSICKPSLWMRQTPTRLQPLKQTKQIFAPPRSYKRPKLLAFALRQCALHDAVRATACVLRKAAPMQKRTAMTA